MLRIHTDTENHHLCSFAEKNYLKNILVNEEINQNLELNNGETTVEKDFGTSFSEFSLPDQTPRGFWISR